MSKPNFDGAGFDPDIPCGNCDVGVYCEEVFTGPLADAVGSGDWMPRCKVFDRDCVGAKHLLEVRP